jgi:hypothetical protein
MSLIIGATLFCELIGVSLRARHRPAGERPQAGDAEDDTASLSGLQGIARKGTIRTPSSLIGPAKRPFATIFRPCRSAPSVPPYLDL